MIVILTRSLRGKPRDPRLLRVRPKTLTMTKSQSAEVALGVCAKTWWRASRTRRSAGGAGSAVLCACLGGHGGGAHGVLAFVVGRLQLLLPTNKAERMSPVPSLQGDSFCDVFLS